MPGVPLCSELCTTLTHAHVQATEESSTNDANKAISSKTNLTTEILQSNVNSIQDLDDSFASNNFEIDNSLSEQDVRDVLFEAGYPVNAINDILAAKTGLGNPLDSTVSTNDSDLSSAESVSGNAFDILKEIRVKNIDKVVIGTLNINSLGPKLDQLSEVIGKHLDILTIQETKLDSSFPTQQLALAGYSEPYRMDRNREGGGVLVYVREDIPSKLLTKHTFTKNVEGLFLEINLRKTKLLFFGGYRSDHEVYGLSKADFLNQLSFALDKYSSYERTLLAGDFNIDKEEEVLQDFLSEQNVKNLVKEKTCFDKRSPP